MDDLSVITPRMRLARPRGASAVNQLEFRIQLSALKANSALSPFFSAESADSVLLALLLGTSVIACLMVTLWIRASEKGIPVSDLETYGNSISNYSTVPQQNFNPKRTKEIQKNPKNPSPIPTPN